MTGFSSFTDTEGETSSEKINNEFMAEDSSEDDGDVSSPSSCLRWLPSSAADWATFSRKRDPTGCSHSVDGIPPHKKFKST